MVLFATLDFNILSNFFFRGSLHKIIHRCEIDEKRRIKMALDVVRVKFRYCSLMFFICMSIFHNMIYALSVGKRHELPPYKCTNDCSQRPKITKLTG